MAAELPSQSSGGSSSSSCGTAAQAAPGVPAALKKSALYCTPHVRLPGNISVNAETVLFEPDLQHESVRQFGVGEYQIFLEVRDVIDCGAMAMPLEDESSGGGDRVAYFLQLHVRTLDGRQFCHPEDAEHAWCVVFWMQSREDLQETARCLIAHLDVLRRPDMPKPSRKRSYTAIPFACLDCMSEFEAASSRRKASESKAAAPSSPKRTQARGSRGPGGASPPAAAAAPAEPVAAPCWQGPDLIPGDVEKPLLSDSMADLITEHLPALFRVAGNVTWRLAYTPKAHGVSLQTFYRTLEPYAATVLLVQDAAGHIFGGYCTQPWVAGGLRGFFGSGEAFVFTFGASVAEEQHPQLKCFTWCGQTSNQSFQYADSEYFALGGGSDGRHALAIKDDFLHGYSFRSSTFDSPPLASQEEFIVRDLEVWALEEKSAPQPGILDLR